MKKFVVVMLLLALCVSAFAQKSFFVSAAGDDSKNGLTEQTAFATLEKAVEAAAAGTIKRITVIGTLHGNTVIEDTGRKEILITGKPNASELDKAVLTGDEMVLQIFGNSRIRPENITIQGSDDANKKSQGIVIVAAHVTLGTNLIITQCFSGDGAGVFLVSGMLIMTSNAAITGNRVQRNGGGIVIAGGTLLMSGNAVIKDNEAVNGGGILIRNGTLLMSGNAVIRDNKARNGGGIYLWDGSVQLKGNSLVTENTARYGGGVYTTSTRLTFKGGKINRASFTGQTFKTGNIRGNVAGVNEAGTESNLLEYKLEEDDVGHDLFENYS